MNNEICPVYIINLKEKNDFLIRTLNELRKTNLFDFISIKDAVDKEKAKDEHFKFITEKAYENINVKLNSLNVLPTWGSVGCAMSHLECWKDMINKNFNYAIICEDDIKINNVNKLKYCYYNSLKKIKSTIPTFISFCSEVETSYDTNDIQSIFSSFTGTSCYMINLQAVISLVSLFPITKQIDIEIGGLNKLSKFFYKYSGVNNYNHNSSVQYYFLDFENFEKIFEQYLPYDILKIIYNYLPKKSDFNNNYGGYYGNYDNSDYYITYN
jgi:GR25 family glycosyltransferase involved in LPS biosynthesis